MNKLILILLAGLPALAPGSGASVEIGTNSIPLRVLTETPRSFDTNRVAREFSLYCASSSRIEDFFTADPSVPGSSGQMDPNEPEGGPPETAAENIRYHATPDERIEMGPLGRVLRVLLPAQVLSLHPVRLPWLQALRLRQGRLKLRQASR